MNIFHIITSNYIVNVCIIAWFCAQLLKTIITFAMTDKLDLERMFGAGGMPSSHSALVCALAVGMARKLGYASPEFALSFAFAAIVMYDAMGVRRAAGEQAKVLNKMLFSFTEFFGPEQPTQEEPQKELAEPVAHEDEKEKKDAEQPEKTLKEFLGHTPLEVLGGALLGILVAILIPVK